MGEESLFGLTPDQLEKLFSVCTDGGDVSESEGGDSAPMRDAAPEGSSGRGRASGPASLLAAQIGTRIDRYRLLGVLGEGGMGVVYLAEQEHPIKRHVAIKVIKPGMDSERVIARFEAERQALAMLDHPNIAHVLDAGTTEQGRPYFVMEYVEGSPVTEHCDKNKLSIEERLRLFIHVCQAVHHAHQKGIIHRDIKPSNILVAVQDGQPVPKVIDFGVARALSQPLTQQTLLTQQGQLIGTPEYMSPEQIDLADGGTDMRSDVYSLGVLLYVLLAGALPLESETLREGGLEQLRQMVRERDPLTPSTRLTGLGEKAVQIALNRRTDVRTLARDLRKELEWIPLKAMRKECEQRYQSAVELAQDIRNYLDGTALIAGPPSRLYRVRKFVRRRRALVAGITGFLLVLIAGITVSTFFGIGQARARAKAEQEARTSQAVTEILMGYFEYGSSYSTPGYTTAPAEDLILALGSHDMTARLQQEPLVEAILRLEFGRLYDAYGQYKAAAQQVERAMELYQEHAGAEHQRTLIAMQTLASVYRDLGRLTEATRLGEYVRNVRRQTLGDGHRDTLTAMNGLALTYHAQERIQEAQDLWEKAVSISRRASGEENDWTLIFTKNLASLYRSQGRYDQARPMLERIISPSQGYGLRSPLTLDFQTELAQIYQDMGRYQEAEALLRQTLKNRIIVHEPPGATWTMLNLASLCVKQGRLDEAERLYTRVYRLGQDRVGEDSPTLIPVTTGLGVVCREQGRYQEADEWFSKALEAGHRGSADGYDKPLDSMSHFGVLRRMQGQFDQAEELLKTAYEGRLERFGEYHPDTLASLYELAVLHKEQGKNTEAQEEFTSVLEARRKMLGDDHPDTLATADALGVLYTKLGRYDAAESLLARAAEVRRQQLGDRHPHTLVSCRHMIDLYRLCSRPEKANEWQAILETSSAKTGAGDEDGQVGAAAADNIDLLSYLDAEETTSSGQVPGTTSLEALLLNAGATWGSLGQISYDQETDTYTIAGSGRDIWEKSDEFHFAYKTLDGDGSIVAKIESLENVDPWAKVGVMIRDDLTATTRHAMVVATPENRICLQYRTVQDSTAQSTHSDPNHVTWPHWIKLTRAGGTFTAQHSKDGNVWQDVDAADSTQPSSVAVKMSPKVYIGLVATSHRGRWQTVEGKMSNVAVTGKVEPEGEFLWSEDIGFKMMALPDK
jgi:non-specific serine/threonine protein kinase/serine/threonine-protein kinase